MPRVALYRRVSSKKQLDGVSLEDQLHILNAYAARQGWDIVEDYVEQGRSAFTENLAKREAFQRMLADAHARKFDIVLVYKLNRFARKVLIQYQAAAELERCRVQIASATEPVERTTASGRATFGVLAVLAELQSDQLSEKMRDTRKAEARQGRHVGPVPVGFRRECGVLVPNEQIGAPRLAFALYATRQHSYSTVAEALNQAGWRMPTGGAYTKFQVEEMLKNPVYAGRVRCGDQEYDGGHESVIDQAIWDAVQVEIARRASLGNHDYRAPARPALLSGLARCSNCGEPMWFSTSGRNKSYDYYSCGGRSRGGRDPRCNLRSVRAVAAEAHIVASMAALSLDRRLLDDVAREIDTLAHGEQPRPIVDRAQIDAKLKRLARLYEDGLKSDDEYQRERDRLRALLIEQVPAPRQVSPSAADAVALLADLPGLLAQATREELRPIIEELFEDIYLTPHQVMAARPTALFAPLLRRARLKVCAEWAGWALVLRDHNTLTIPLHPAATMPLLLAG